VLGVLASTACGSSRAASLRADGTVAAHPVSVVASTDVWGNVAASVAGTLADSGTSRVKITSIISDPTQDPHSYEANVKTQLELSRAAVVIENGGGYDDFIDSMLKTVKNSSARVLNAVAISGRQAPAGGDLNEHLWYDFPTVAKVVDQLAIALAAADPSDAATFQANATAFKARLAELENTEAAIKAQHAGAGVAITEPVPLYLLAASGLINGTPTEFSQAVEAETDVAPRILQQTLALFSGAQVKLLAYNSQTSSPSTERVLAAAKANKIPVVPVTETLPAGRDYLSWMSDNLSAVQSALAG
jgi:zinc/manganese transport system substrate-binding protein